MLLGIVTSSIHKVPPPWLGFAMLFGLLLCGTLRKKELKEKVDWTFLLYLGGITGIVAAFNYLGLDTVLGAALPGLGTPVERKIVGVSACTAGALLPANITTTTPSSSATAARESATFRRRSVYVPALVMPHLALLGHCCS
jgi:di/tricarboxylate transporter